ncbi:hypothetical protein BGZ60DRAFT_385182 [Tricladium varicosporioides]|nr:hypothetical protein BGZ60DRAFT_385182 [Hymenoscyphus varicosporioides]
MSADKAPVEKLPLAARKNVRDGWEAKKPALEATILGHLGVPWTFEVNPNLIYAYAEQDSYAFNSLGDCINAYFEAFEWSLKSFIENHGETGKNELNSVCTAHIITLLPSTKFSYCGAEVVDGKLCLVFHPNSLGSNISHVAQDLPTALSTAPQPAGASSLSYVARHSIETDYDTQIQEMLTKARTVLQNEKWAFTPDFEQLGDKLKNGGKDVRDDWQTNLGSFAKSYFESFVDALAREKFEEDDLLREGLEEGVPNLVVRLRLVDKLESGYNRLVLDSGDLVIETTPNNWGTNIHYACEKLVDIL